MKKQLHPLMAAVIALCLAAPAFASAPATSTEAKQSQPEQIVAKAKKPKAPKKAKKGSAA